MSNACSPASPAIASPIPGVEHTGSRRGDTPIRRRRRRILSCDTCRRLKYRCVMDASSNDCLRCRTLQLHCSKSQRNASEHVTIRSTSSQNGSQSRTRQTVGSNKDATAAFPRPDHASDRTESGDADAMRSGLGEDDTNTSRPGCEDAVDPVDHNVQASPAEVIRKVGKQLNGGQRRTFDRSTDLVMLGILDKTGADELVSITCRGLRHTLGALDGGDDRDLRAVSPFLHTVYCLLGMRWGDFTDEMRASLHRETYEVARQMLGDVMLITPLPIDEINGILIMAQFATSPTRGDEYIDSWLLSGHCAQQAMLSFNFSEMSARISDGTVTASDHRAIRIWANTCLVILHWAATSGRPPTIPSLYLNQCKLLLNLEQATLRDGMLVAEVELFTILHDQFVAKQYLDKEGSSKQIVAWKSKWNHLLGLLTSGILNLGHSAAWLLLSRRTVEARKEADDYANLLPFTPGTSSNLEDAASAYPRQRDAELILYESAVSLLQTYVALGTAVIREAPEFYHTCVPYALLVLSKYDLQSRQATRVEMSLLLRRLKELYSTSIRRSAAVEFSLERAMARIEND